MIGLTRRQTDLLDYIKSHMKEHDISPSFEEMGAALGMSKSQVHRLVSSLEERGAISRPPHRARGIEIVDREACAQLPFLPANHRQYLIWYASKNKTTPQAIVANCVREWAVRSAQ
jgi:SOS-response transcriptional repressor LexA